MNPLDWYAHYDAQAVLRLLHQRFNVDLQAGWRIGNRGERVHHYELTVTSAAGRFTPTGTRAYFAAGGENAADVITEAARWLLWGTQ